SLSGSTTTSKCYNRSIADEYDASVLLIGDIDPLIKKTDEWVGLIYRDAIRLIESCSSGRAINETGSWSSCDGVYTTRDTPFPDSMIAKICDENSLVHTKGDSGRIP